MIWTRDQRRCWGCRCGSRRHLQVHGNIPERPSAGTIFNSTASGLPAYRPASSMATCAELPACSLALSSSTPRRRHRSCRRATRRHLQHHEDDVVAAGAQPSAISTARRRHRSCRRGARRHLQYHEDNVMDVLACSPAHLLAAWSHLHFHHNADGVAGVQSGALSIQDDVGTTGVLPGTVSTSATISTGLSASSPALSPLP